MPGHVEPGRPETVCHGVDNGHVFSPSGLATKGEPIEAICFVIQSLSEFCHVVKSRLIWHCKSLLLEKVFSIHEEGALPIEGQSKEFPVVGKAVSKWLKHVIEIVFA